MRCRNIGKRLEKLEAQARLEEGLEPGIIVSYKYPATATEEEREALKAEAMERFKAEHPGRRSPIITLGLGYDPASGYGPEEGEDIEWLKGPHTKS